MLNLKKTVEDIWPVAGKRFLVRVDFNVPLKDGVIQNDYRIRSALPTIQHIIRGDGIAILMSHLGRPKGVKMGTAGTGGNPPGYEAEASLKPVAAALSAMLGKDVAFAPDCLNAAEAVKALRPGSVILLENVRFYAEEGSKKEAERMAMAERLAALGDYFVSDAFGTAHRDSATMTGIAKVLGHGASGFLMAKEVKYFAAALNNPKRPIVAVVGGAKVSDKIQLLQHMLKRINKLIIGGAMAYTFLKAKGCNVGKSFLEGTITDEKGRTTDTVALAQSILDEAARTGVEVFLPVDHVCNTEFKECDAPLVTADANVPADYMGLDIGPKSIELFTAQIEECMTCIWNGPMGVFEKPCYSAGTFAVAKAMAEGTQKRHLLSIIGGGDSASAAEVSGYADKMSHVSTGGGASLELLEGKDLPGVTALDNAE